MAPLDCLTVAVRVTGALCGTVVAEAARVVVVEATEELTRMETVFEVEEATLVEPE